MNIFVFEFIFPKFFFQNFFSNIFFLKFFFQIFFSKFKKKNFFQHFFFDGLTLDATPFTETKRTMYLWYEKYDKQPVEIGL